MAGVLINAASNVKKQFTLNQEVDSSNSVFKLFSKVTVGICIIASILVASNEYLGKPITCQTSAGHVGDDVYEAFCWIHGGRKIQASEEMKEIWKCHANQHDDTRDTLYYQWVVFMLAINAMLFRIPHILWKFLEGGIMKNFHSEKSLKSDLIYYDGDMNKHLKNHIAYFKKLRNRRVNTISYYAKFQFCQLLNIVMLILNFWATNQFLSGGFKNYGTEVVNFLTTSDEEWDSSDPGPMCQTFPTVVGCTFATAGKAGGTQIDNGLCILSQNIINEKIYLFLWFWWILLFVVGGLRFLFDLAILSTGAFRTRLIEQKLDLIENQGMRDFINQLGVGDWFILYQIGKNTNEEFFHAFIENLSNPKTFNALSEDDTAPLVTIVDSKDGMELKQRTQAEDPE